MTKVCKFLNFRFRIIYGTASITFKRKNINCQKHVRHEYSINVQRLWSKEMSNNPSHGKTIRSLINKFEQTGSVVNNDTPGRSVSIIDQTTRDEQFWGKESQSSTDQMSSDLNISRSSIRRIYKALGYKLGMHRFLFFGDKDDSFTTLRIVSSCQV